MSLWQKFFHKDENDNQHKNHAACVENDCSCHSDEQLIKMLKESDDEDVIHGIKKVLNSRGYTKKELEQLLKPVIS